MKLRLSEGEDEKMEHVKFEKDGKVGIITMNYKKENRFNPAFVNELLSVMDEAEKDDDVGAVVVTGGDPKFWSNGLDLEYLMMSFSEPKAVLDYLNLCNGMFKRWCLYPKPTVAALNGHTFAGGLFMAGYFDFRLMREDRGWICMPEVDINIPLLPGMIAICLSTMTEQGFRKMYYTGARLTAPEAVEIGFVDRTCSMENLLPESIEFAAELAKKKTKTYAEMKKRYRGEIARILEEEDPPYFEVTIKSAVPS
ncbi:enoyl-CoA hydratase/isomerase family protein [bacterium]